MEAAGFRRLFRILSLRTKLGKLSPACWTSGGRFAKRRPLEGFPVPSAGRIAQLVEQLTLNQRVPGSSPGAPTKLFNSLGILRASHSDRRSAAIPTNWLLLFAPRDASWSPRSAVYVCVLHKLATG